MQEYTVCPQLRWLLRQEQMKRTSKQATANATAADALPALSVTSKRISAGILHPPALRAWAALDLQQLHSLS